MPRQWDELACPECSAENVVITEDRDQHIPDRVLHAVRMCCSGVTWNSRFLDKIKEHRPYDAMLPEASKQLQLIRDGQKLA